MADKAEARKKAAEASVPLVPGTPADATQEELGRFAREVGFPVIFKAVAGGSGRGMRVVRSAGELEEKRREAEAEALAAFQNGSVFLEKFLERPRHIEVQVFGDHWGNIVHFGERECSVQRRHQKIIEEAPAWNLSPTVREGLRSAALKLAQAVQYTNSGTVEFLVENGESDHGRFYFVEMNTRIQVEHPVTEVVTNTDLVKLQLQVARGERLPYKQEEIQLHGHAFEFRIYAENPSTGFSPTSGEIRYMSRSGGPWVREDGWAEPGTKISPYYDSLISKLIVSGATREEALARSRRALDECLVEGMETTLLFHRWFLAEGILEREAVDVYWIGREYHGERRNAPLVGPLRLPKTGEDPKITEDE
jgi:acetyl-CoA carboxylase biotin carboxylase subunit